MTETTTDYPAWAIDATEGAREALDAWQKARAGNREELARLTADATAAKRRYAAFMHWTGEDGESSETRKYEAKPGTDPREVGAALQAHREAEAAVRRCREEVSEKRALFARLMGARFRSDEGQRFAASAYVEQQQGVEDALIALEAALVNRDAACRLMQGGRPQSPDRVSSTIAAIRADVHGSAENLRWASARADGAAPSEAEEAARGDGLVRPAGNRTFAERGAQAVRTHGANDRAITSVRSSR